MGRTRLFNVAIAALTMVTAALVEPPHPARAATAADCLACHAGEVAGTAGGKHAAMDCVTCHEGDDAHLAAPADPTANPKVHFDQEVCKACHVDQYNTFEVVSRGPTVYGGGDAGPTPPKGWSKTWDPPYWNVLIDGHPFVLETYEDSPMAVNQIEHQETIRPGSEACLECHGTKVAFAMGIEYRDRNGVLHSIPATKRTVALPNGTVVDVPAREYVLKEAHTIHDGTSHRDAATGVWDEAVTTTVVPAGTRMWTYTDAVNLSGGPYAQPYQVKTVVTLPAPRNATLHDGSTIGFQTISSYPESGADIDGMDPNGEIAALARNWIYAAFEALAFDGLDYYFNDPGGVPVFSGGGANWPSVASGELCNQCHDPHSGKLRIVRKALVAAIAERGMNPYSPTGRNVLSFEAASRQDQIIAVCAQCHSEYVGGYSANTGLDQDYFPWAKPDDLETQYTNLFGYLQDWTHGGPVAPWQSSTANARGFFPYQERFPIAAPLVKVQHPEAEVFLDSPMYNAGATCTDCHATRVTRPDGSRYTSHWFASPLKIMEGFNGPNRTGSAMNIPPRNPCNTCHHCESSTRSRQRVLDVQNRFSLLQERTQVALVNALRYIGEQQALGADVSAQIQSYQRAAMRWEYYTQAENSMGFHNVAESLDEVSQARIWVDGFIPWPLTPVNARISTSGAASLTLTFYDQATDENSFVIERATALGGPYGLVANLPTPNGVNLGDVEWTDTGLASGSTYFYRVAAVNAAGQSVFSIWAQGTTTQTALQAPTNLRITAVGRTSLGLAWNDNSTNEDGFVVQRSTNGGLTWSSAATLGPGATSYTDTGLSRCRTYWYRVRAFNANGDSAFSNVVSARIR